MLRYLLLTDGSSDECLVDVINWLLRDLAPALEVSSRWADPSEYRPGSLVLKDRLARALIFYDCDIIFIHRDAEKEPFEARHKEAIDAIHEAGVAQPIVILVPVRMMEAWLLTDSIAIRKAAGNPNGQMPIKLPAISEIEKQPDPKKLLNNALLTACGLPPLRKKKFETGRCVRRVAELTQDFSPLRELKAFKQFEKMTISALNQFQKASAGV